jgi:hypothetical protein
VGRDIFLYFFNGMFMFFTLHLASALLSGVTRTSSYRSAPPPQSPQPSPAAKTPVGQYHSVHGTPSRPMTGGSPVRVNKISIFV